MNARHILLCASFLAATHAHAQNTCATADSSLASGQWDAAIAGYNDCLRTQPDSFGIRSNMGVALSHLGRMTEAIESYKKALALAPDNEKIEFNLAVTLIKSGNYDEAVTHLRHLDRTGDDIRYSELLAFCYYRLSSYSLAARAAEKVYASHPDDPANALILGSTYTRMGMYEKAVPLITLALKAAGSAEGHLILAQTQLGLHQYRPAWEELKQAAAIDPNLAGLHTALGTMFVGIDEPHEAEKEFELALKQDANDYEANYFLGRLKRMDRDRESAKKYLATADRLQPNSPEVMYERAQIAIEELRYADAVPLLEAVTRAEPDNSQAYLMLSESYQRTGRREDAQREGELYNAKRQELHAKEGQPKP